MIGALTLLLFLVPVAALVWRVVVTKSRSALLRIGGAGAAVAGTVGALVVRDRVATFDFRDERSAVALAAASSASFYLLLWALRHHTNRRHRTMSLIAALVGFVPLIAIAAAALIYPELQR